MELQLTILGTSSAIPTSDKNLSAHVLQAGERIFLFDCGEGTQMQLRRNKIKLSHIQHIFITHLHGDHIFGLPGLLSTLSLLGYGGSIHIYSPPGLKKIINTLFRYLRDKLSYQLVYQELQHEGLQQVLDDGKNEVYAFPLHHSTPTYGYLFRQKKKQANIKKEFIDLYKPAISEIVKIKEGGDYHAPNGEFIPHEKITIAPPKPKSYAYVTDTAYCEEIIPWISGVDLLYHESTFMKENEKEASLTMHSTAIQAATIAQKSGVQRLLIGHLSTRYKDREDEVLQEARQQFSNTLMAKEGEQHEV